MISIAILGCGVVGGGVADLIAQNAKTISSKLGGEGETLLCVKYVLDKRTNIGHGLDGCVTTDLEKILNDDQVSIVVETMGGVHPAYEFTKAALKAGKSVVTSNKAVVSACGEELMDTARENGVAYLFEASVGGGIPIIRPLMSCLAANRIERISGILNGTTNFILTEMEKNGTSFGEALKKAQSLGYAEADPTADVSGADTARKICILANIAYNMYIQHDDIVYEGIENVTAQDVECAAKLGCRIKLLGVASRSEEKVVVYVAPTLVPASDPLALVDGEYNAIVVEGNAVGRLMFSGKGAGALPTASAVVADIIDAATCSPKYPVYGDKSLLDTARCGCGKVYVRTENGEEAEKLAVIAGNSGVKCGSSRAFIVPDGEYESCLAKIPCMN